MASLDFCSAYGFFGNGFFSDPQGSLAPDLRISRSVVSPQSPPGGQMIKLNTQPQEVFKDRDENDQIMFWHAHAMFMIHVLLLLQLTSLNTKKHSILKPRSHNRRWNLGMGSQCPLDLQIDLPLGGSAKVCTPRRTSWFCSSGRNKNGRLRILEKNIQPISHDRIPCNYGLFTLHECLICMFSCSNIYHTWMIWVWKKINQYIGSMEWVHMYTLTLIPLKINDSCTLYT